MADFVSQPEFVEVELGESLISRTETLASFRELGPPDLCHVIKSSGRAAVKDVGSYHYVSGVDASSSAALAAYINSLTYELDQNQAWFSAKGGWKLKSGAYCCFNAFSRVDVRVEVRIPGSVDAYVVDLRGERHETTPEVWQEVYLSALLRAILYADDANYRLAGYRKLDPISSPDAEHRFLQAAENLFFKGWQLGSEPEIQVATVVSNHLTNGILKYFGDANRYDQAVNLFEKLYAREPEVAALVAEAYIGLNEEVKAVQTMHRAIKETPQSYALLHVQVDFLRSKGKHEWAARLAKQAVNCAPSEFVTWAKLTECYIELGQWESALFTLNSCPMFTYNERDLHRMPTPARSHLPVKQFIQESGLLNEDSARDNEADVALLRLPAPALRGTFARAYSLLSRLASKIGWDELLRCRSAVFVMEEEYRAQKAAHDVEPEIAGGDDSDDQKAKEDQAEEARLPVEERSAEQTSEPEAVVDEHGGETDMPPLPAYDESQPKEADDVVEKLDRLGIDSAAGASSQSIPTIKISTESDHEREKAELETYMREQDESGTKQANADESAEVHAQANGSVAEVIEQKAAPQQVPHVHVDPPPLEKPAQAQHLSGHTRSDSSAAASAVHADGPASTLNGHNVQSAHTASGEALQNEDTAHAHASAGFSFTNKRLCERWLDNAFMVLYEDLRVYTIWRAEIVHYRSQSLPYSKTGTEWEILGELALRLNHKEEAKDAFQRCVDGKFSAKALLRLLEIFSEQKDVERTLWAALRLTAYHHRWYMEGAYPSAVAKSLYRLIREVGLSKVSYTLVSMNPPQPILRLMQNYLAYAQLFRIAGCNN